MSKLIVTAADWKFTTDKSVINHVYDTFVRGMAPKSTGIERCLYLGEKQGCAVGCLFSEDIRTKLDNIEERSVGGDRISAITSLIYHGYVELPEGLTERVLGILQNYHDYDMVGGQEDRHKDFPYLDQVTDPLVFA